MPRMRLWRRLQDEDGQSSLQEVYTASPYQRSPFSTDKKSVLIVLPGASTADDRPEYINGAAKRAAHLLGGGDPNPEVEILVGSYRSTREVMDLGRKINTLYNYSDDYDEMFLDDVLIPLMEQDIPITFLATSYGAAQAECIRNRLLERFKYTDRRDLKTKIQNMVLIGIAGVSGPLNARTRRTDGDMNFTSVYVQNADDFTGENLVYEGEHINLNYRNRVPPFHQPGKLTFERRPVALGQQNIIAVTATPPGEMTYWKLSDGYFHLETEREGTEPPAAHWLTYFITRHPDQTPGLVAVIENVLRNAVDRDPSSPPEVADLLMPVSEVPRQKPSFSEALIFSHEEKVIKDALKAMEWREQQSARDSQKIHAESQAGWARFQADLDARLRKKGDRGI